MLKIPKAIYEIIVIMCGIFCLLNSLSQPAHSKLSKEHVYNEFMKGRSRGPENSTFTQVGDAMMGFHRLAINGYGNNKSGQPIVKDNCTLICNGEIYNWNYLKNISDTECSTGSDCEIIINLYRKYGIEQTLQILDGVFAFILIDREGEE